MFDRIRQPIEARDLPLLAGDWSKVHLGMALGRLARRSSWVRDFLLVAESTAGE